MESRGVTGEHTDRPSWFPDWRGECVAIVASGPSTKKADVEVLRNRIHVIAIKQNVDLCPWADVVYGCDAAWWQYRNGLPEFKGLKIVWEGNVELPAPKFPNLHHIQIDSSQNHVFPFANRNYRMLFDQLGLVGSGANSGYQAINLAAQFGATGLLLIGFDADDRSGAHWYGRNNWRNANNPDQEVFGCWQRAFNAAAADLSAMNIEVINASPISALKCFKHKTVIQTLEDWGLWIDQCG